LQEPPRRSRFFIFYPDELDFQQSTSAEGLNNRLHNEPYCRNHLGEAVSFHLSNEKTNRFHQSTAAEGHFKYLMTLSYLNTNTGQVIYLYLSIAGTHRFHQLTAAEGLTQKKYCYSKVQKSGIIKSAGTELSLYYYLPTKALQKMTSFFLRLNPPTISNKLPNSLS